MQVRLSDTQLLAKNERNFLFCHCAPLSCALQNRGMTLKQAVNIFQAAESGEFTRISRQQLQYSNEKTSRHQIRSKASAKRCNYTRT